MKLDYDKKKENLRAGFETAYIDSDFDSNLAYRPEFVSNDYKQGKKVIASIEKELEDCDEFCISVAFITRSGITPLLQTFRELEKKNIPGKILTTDYLMFSDPKALEILAGLKNLTVKMYRVNNEDGGFHTKGYIFKKEEIYNIIIGSSNMTLNAITKNREWNTRIVSTEDGSIVKDILCEFNELWNCDNTVEFLDFIEDYKIKYKVIQEQRKIAKKENIVNIEQYKLTPNNMQINFIGNLEKMVDSGEDKALLLSSTGTGKTYASAFALREMNPSKVLFVVHREQIAKQAKRSFQNVFGSSKTFGILSGNKKETDKDFIFSTVQMMSKENIYTQFEENEFDVIIIDEVHRAGAESYQKIMDYFTPKLYLGMTASPDRMDGFDIYSLFDHNIAYEIRLQQAMEENLLCPFHYFGITDIEIDGEIFNDQTGLRQFENLISDKRVDYILEQSKYYGYSGERVKGLIFVSRKEEARELSRKFNERGLNTTFLSGEDSQERREECILRLTGEDVGDEESDDVAESNKLDYIFTVDIFNEGVDIPEINQVIMLRPTQSPVVFIQQLGRGLRKTQNKEFVVILDFIGNYTNNFMIPIALSGDKTYNKDNLRHYVLEGDRIIPGASTIHFDEIARKNIFKSLDNANFNDVKLIKENYINLKNKLGRIPSLLDFDKYGEMDVLRIFDNKSLGSYYNFLIKYEKEYTIRLSEKQEKMVKFISQKLASGKRIHELEMLNRMLTYRVDLIKSLKKSLKDKYNICLNENGIKNVVNVMTNQFAVSNAKKTFESCVFIKKDEENNDYKISEEFEKMLKDNEFYEIIKELIQFGKKRYERDYSNRYENTNFELYQKYTYEDVCRLLEWESNEVPLNISGYKYDSKTKTFPVFINYDKADDISDTTKYEDHFESPNRLIAVSKQSRSIESEDVQNFIHAKERGIDVELFVRKNKDDKISKEFYYLGRMKATGMVNPIIIANTDKSAVEIEWILDVPVREDVYEYIVNE